jgi:hypothetical protein
VVAVAGAPGDATASAVGPDQDDGGEDRARDGEAPSGSAPSVVVLRPGEGVTNRSEPPVEVLVAKPQRRFEVATGRDLVPADRWDELEQIGMELDTETLGEAPRSVDAGAGLGDHRALRIVRAEGSRSARLPRRRDPRAVV